MAKYDDKGREIPDQTPLEVPLHFRRPLSLREEMMRMIRIEMSREAVESGSESFEEANDFDVDDDEFPVGKHEIDEDDEFRLAEQNMLDKAARDMHNEGALDKERTTGEDDGGRNGRAAREGGEAVEAERSGEESDVDGARDVRKEHAAVGGEGRAAAERGGRVPKGRKRD